MKAPTAGFTFVEVLIVTAILAVITAAIFPIVYEGQYSYQSEKRLLDATQQARVAMDQIVRYVRQAGSDPKELGTFAPVDILQTSPWRIRINSDITGFVPSTTGNSMESTGDPDKALNSIYERVTVRHGSNDAGGVMKILIDVGYGEEVVAENIPTLNFTFFDARGNPTADPNVIARVKVLMVVETNIADPKTGKISSVTLESDVFIRNKSWELFQD